MYSHISESLKSIVYTYSNVIYYLSWITWFLEEFDHFCTFLRKKNTKNITPPSFKRNRKRHQNVTCWNSHHWNGVPGAMPSSPNIFNITTEIHNAVFRQMHPHWYICKNIYIYIIMLNTLCIPYDFPAFRHDVSFSTGRKIKAVSTSATATGWHNPCLLPLIHPQDRFHQFESCQLRWEP